MKTSLFLILLSLTTQVFAATPVPSKKVSEKEFIKLLEENKIMAAALSEAKTSTGAKTCDYTFDKLEYASAFEAGSTFDFSVHIKCAGKSSPEYGESQAFITASGRWFNKGKGIQAIDKFSFQMAD